MVPFCHMDSAVLDLPSILFMSKKTKLQTVCWHVGDNIRSSLKNFKGKQHLDSDTLITHIL